jgi:hypothetical protein
VAIGCPGVLFPVVGSVMRSAHQAAPAAEELGLEGVGGYGFDGWYVGRRDGRKVGLAAVHVRSYSFIRWRRYTEASQVAVWVDHASQPAPGVTVAGQVVGEPLPPDEIEALERWMQQHGEDLTMLNADEVAFADTGAALIVTWPGASPTEEEAEAWIERLLPLARELER